MDIRELKKRFSYSNSYSLKMGCKKIEEKDIEPGDMIVQNEDGGIGHVSAILDVCISAAGEKLYLIGFSFMPAQEFHIEKPRKGQGIGVWFTLDGFYQYLNYYMPLGSPVIRRF